MNSATLLAIAALLVLGNVAACGDPSPGAQGSTSQGTASPPLKLNGAFGVSWGDDEETVKNTLSPDHALIGTSRRGGIYFKGGTIAGQKAKFLEVQFYRHQAMEITVVFEEKDQDTIFPQYDRLKSMIQAKYGQPDRNVHRFKRPYNASDEDRAGYVLSLGKLDHYASWLIDPDSENGEQIPNTIIITALKEMVVVIDYADGRLARAKEVAEEDKSKDER